MSNNETTCTARLVDGAVRGLAAGALWGYFSAPNGSFDDASLRRLAILQSMGRNAANFSAFLAIFSGVYCTMTAARPRSKALAAGTAGAAAGTFIAARSSSSPRMALLTAGLCGVGSAVAGGIGGGGRKVGG